MIKTQIQLEEYQYKKLKAIGARSEKGLAEQVREAVALYLAREQKKDLPLIETALGHFKEVPTDDLKPHDRFWVESGR